MGKPCPQCGQPTDDGQRVCTQCGTLLQPANAAQTMLGFSSPLAAPPQSRAQPPSQALPQPQPEPAQPAAPAKTMLGFAAPAELRAALQQHQAAPPPQPDPPAAGGAKPAIAKTMLGVAMPGIAPVHTPPADPAAPLRGSASGTMLGVAVPGIAPLHSQPGAALPQRGIGQRTLIHEPLPAILPAPAPFIPEAAPAAPTRAARSGVPLAIAAAVVGVLVLVGGVVLLVLSHSAPPITATAKVSADGKEQLHLRCESCADGTTAAWKGAKTTFAKKEADLDLPAPLAIGDNVFELAIDRPGHGRDETVKLVMPLAYRIRGDVSGILEMPPVIRVRIEAQPGAAVSLDGKPVALDGSGNATVSYDISEDTTGEADETRTVERKMPYEVVGADKKKSTGEVVVRVGVVPLHIDAPGPALVTDQAAIWVAGRTAKGAEVSANGAPLTVAPDGMFEGKVDVAPGTQTVTVRAAAAKDAAVKVAPRTASSNVNRVASLDTASAADGASTVSGSVVDARVAHHHSTILVDDRRSCAQPPCLVRVDYGAETPVQAGDSVTAWGTSGKSVTTPEGKTLSVLQAQLLRKDKKKR